MEKEFIPYEQALALKELEFDEPCYCFYNGKFLQWKIDDSEGTEVPHINPNKNIGLCVSAPLYQQCFRWFREKYGYLAYIDMDNYSYYRFTIYYGKGVSVAPHKNYEEAELECLKKLIEIVKEK